MGVDLNIWANKVFELRGWQIVATRGIGTEKDIWTKSFLVWSVFELTGLHCSTQGLFGIIITLFCSLLIQDLTLGPFCYAAHVYNTGWENLG